MKKILITGGSGAIGSMTAYLAARKGYEVVFTYYKNEEAAKSLQEDLAKMGGSVRILQGDLTKDEDRARIMDETGAVDILVNNFGVARYQPFYEETAEGMEECLNANLLSHMALTRLALPSMLSKKCGAIINISSVWGQTGGSCEVTYSAAKAGLIGFTKALAKELAPSGITVNCVAPGCVESKMLGDLDRDALKEMIPTEKLTNGLDVAEAILFLAEQEQITGQVLPVNGGMYI